MKYKLMVEVDGLSSVGDSGVFRDQTDLRHAVESVLEMFGERFGGRKMEDGAVGLRLDIRYEPEDRKGVVKAGVSGQVRVVEAREETVGAGDVKKGDRVRFVVKKWFRDKAELGSMELEGEVKAVTERALLVEGSASVRESKHCLRCGLEITNPVSQWCGYGPVCSEYVGVERVEVEERGLSEDEKEEVRGRIVEETWFGEKWFPKSQVMEVVRVGGEVEKGVPPAEEGWTEEMSEVEKGDVPF
jgi:hypothetical protein